MSDLYLDPTTHDITLVGDDLELTTGADATVQRLKQTFLAVQQEWFLDLSDGIPYYQYILVKNPDVQVVQQLLLDAALGVPGVLEILEFDVDYDSPSRTLSVSGSYRTNDDVIDFTQILGGST